MNDSKTIHWSALLVLCLGAGCSPSSREDAEQVVNQAAEAGRRLAEASEEVAHSVEQGGEGLGEAMQRMQNAVGVDGEMVPIDFRDLKTALPSGIEGFTAGKAIGERTRVMGIGSSQAEIRLSNPEGWIRVRITDAGSVAGWAALAERAAGAFSELDRETEHGFERSGMVDGVPTQESHDGLHHTSRIRLFYGERFSIELTGRNVGWEDMEAARDAIDVKRLDELKAQSAETASAADTE